MLRIFVAIIFIFAQSKTCFAISLHSADGISYYMNLAAQKYKTFTNAEQMHEYLGKYIGSKDQSKFKRRLHLDEKLSIPKLELIGNEAKLWSENGKLTTIQFLNISELLFLINGRNFKFQVDNTLLDNITSLEKIFSNEKVHSRVSLIFSEANASISGIDIAVIFAVIVFLNTAADATQQADIGNDRETIEKMTKICSDERKMPYKYNSFAPKRNISPPILSNTFLIDEKYSCSGAKKTTNWLSLARLGWESYKKNCDKTKELERCLDHLKVKIQEGYHLSRNFEKKFDEQFSNLKLVHNIQSAQPPPAPGIQDFTK